MRWASDTAPRRATAAKLWNPDDLLALLLDASADIVAMGRRTGSDDPGDGQEGLESDIMAQIAAWRVEHDPTWPRSRP